jgi:GNAT superfamily N-acetyltransferase
VGSGGTAAVPQAHVTWLFVTIDAARPPIRRLGPADRAACVALAADRDWNPEERKWSLLLETTEPFGVDAPDGAGLAGVVVLARYAALPATSGPSLATVGMMLVARRYGGQGIGRALMTHLLAEAGEATVFLTATEQGRPLYEKVGMRIVGYARRFKGRFRPADGDPQGGAGGRDGGVVREATAADIDGIVRADRAAFGADREYLLRRLPAFIGRLLVLDDGEEITGYGGAWVSGGVTVIGPVVAPGEAAARLLISHLAAVAPGQVRLDLNPGRDGLPAWAIRRGLAGGPDMAMLARGEWPPPGQRDHLYAPITGALG